MSRPSNAEFRSVIDDLLRLAEQQTDLRTRGRTTRMVLVLGGLELELLETVRACLLLLDNGLGEASLPLVRKCYEYGVVAQWLNVTQQSNAYFVVSKTNWHKLDKEALKSGVTFPIEVIHEMESVPPPDKTPDSNVLENFAEVCNSFQAGGLYLLYRHLSGSVHPWFAATCRWLHEDDNPTGLRFEDPPKMDPVMMLWPLAAGLLWVGRALDLHIVHKPRQSALQDAGRRLGIDTVLKAMPSQPKPSVKQRK